MPIYVVVKGHKPGLYKTWENAEKQIAGYPGSSYKVFKDSEERNAIEYQKQNNMSGLGKLKIKPVIFKKKITAPAVSLSEIEKSYFNHSDYLESNVLAIYTDGSTIGNGKKNATGGYGVFFGRPNIPNISIAMKTGKVTNNITELKAIIDALKYISSHNVKAVIYYDSDYASGVITGRKKAHTNLEIVNEGKMLLRACKVKPVFHHVYSHTGAKDLHSIGNEIADLLAKCKKLI
jgi:ribonuclease HI